MVDIATIAVLDAVSGILGSLGLLYLLYVGPLVVHYQRFFRLVTFGLLIFAVTGPVFGTVVPALIHAIHGVAALFVVIGLYDLLRTELAREEAFEVVLGTEAPAVEADGR